MSSHAANAFGSGESALLKSGGSSCTTPSEIPRWDIVKLSRRHLIDIFDNRIDKYLDQVADGVRSSLFCFAISLAVQRAFVLSVWVPLT
jgi:hypothetical protein